MKVLLVLLFALACFGVTLFMPWAELGLPSVHVPIISDIFSPVRSIVVSSLSLASKDKGTFDYYVYSIFLALALIFAAIGVSIVGREDAEEKTVLPAKK